MEAKFYFEMKSITLALKYETVSKMKIREKREKVSEIGLKKNGTHLSRTVPWLNYFRRPFLALTVRSVPPSEA